LKKKVGGGKGIARIGGVWGKKTKTCSKNSATTRQFLGETSWEGGGEEWKVKGTRSNGGPVVVYPPKRTEGGNTPGKITRPRGRSGC